MNSSEIRIWELERGVNSLFVEIGEVRDALRRAMENDRTRGGLVLIDDVTPTLPDPVGITITVHGMGCQTDTVLVNAKVEFKNYTQGFDLFYYTDDAGQVNLFSNPGDNCVIYITYPNHDSTYTSGTWPFTQTVYKLDYPAGYACFPGCNDPVTKSLTLTDQYGSMSISPNVASCHAGSGTAYVNSGGFCSPSLPNPYPFALKYTLVPYSYLSITVNTIFIEYVYNSDGTVDPSAGYIYQIDSITINDHGGGYDSSSPPAIVVAGYNSSGGYFDNRVFTPTHSNAPCKQAVLTANVDTDGSISSITINDPGRYLKFVGTDTHGNDLGLFNVTIDDPKVSMGLKMEWNQIDCSGTPRLDAKQCGTYKGVYSNYLIRYPTVTCSPFSATYDFSAATLVFPTGSKTVTIA